MDRVWLLQLPHMWAATSGIAEALGEMPVLKGGTKYTAVVTNTNVQMRYFMEAAKAK